MIVETSDKILFWSEESIFSNWYPSLITINSNKFPNSESVFMYLKAFCFNDHEVMNEIANSLDLHPRDVKGLGRKIKHFDEKQWLTQRELCMYYACKNKFTQNLKLKNALLDTGNKTLVEASPFDKIWGIGLAPDNPKALNENNWRGLNLLGNVLMKVREELRENNELF